MIDGRSKSSVDGTSGHRLVSSLREENIFMSVGISDEEYVNDDDDINSINSINRSHQIISQRNAVLPS